jgi:uncharacterized protein (TIGR03437 family)
VLARPVSVLTVSALTATLAAGGVVNAATFTPGLAPGGIMALFGTGLSGSGTTTTVDVDGAAAQVIFASPFQVNAVIPGGLAPGTHTVHIKSAYGAAQQSANFAAVAPVIFLIGPGAAAIENQDYSINTPTTPLPRGQVLLVYATGLGATVKQGQFTVASTSVTAIVNGTEIPTAYAGISGYPGLYQINIPIPITTAPGSGVFLTLKQGGQLSNTVTVALQ